MHSSRGAGVIVNPSRAPQHLNTHPTRLRCSQTRRSLRLRAQQSSQGSARGVFPAGKKQARVQLPALILQFTSQEVLQQPEVSRQIDEAAAGGASGVLLSDVSGSGGAELYEAALKVKELLRGRAVLLLADRTDIVGAAEADGVLLGSQGEPP